MPSREPQWPTNLSMMAVFEAAPALYLLLSPSFEILAASDAFLSALRAERSQLVGRNAFEVFADHPDSPQGHTLENLRASFERVLSTRAPDDMAIQRYDLPQPDGGMEERYWKPVNTPVLAGDGTVMAILHRAEDVTDAHRMSALKDDFLSVVSHELRTPLHVLMGFLSILRKPSSGPLTERQLAYMDKLDAVATRLSRLVEDILTAGRIQAGAFALRPVPVALCEVLDHAFKELAPLFDNTGHRLVRDLPTPLPAIEADADRVSQVLYNLLSNAVKFSPEGTTVTVRACEEGDRVRVEVADQGLGIAPEDQPRLFQRFTQLDMTSRRAARGAGLGLAISREIVEAHGGAIGVESRKGQGSTFWFTLPVAAPPETPT